MKIKKLILLLLTFTLIGCGGGGSSSDSSPVGTSDAAAPAALPSGTEISFNPEIVFDGELSVGSPVTASYTNNSSTSSLPAGNNDSVSVTMTIVDGGIQVSFTQAGQSVELILSGFKDFGAGYIEEFTIEAKVDGTSVGTQQGRFTGNTKPKNTAASRTFDVSGTPTEDEFNKFLVGKAIYHQETSPDNRDRGYILFNQDGTFHYLDGDLDGDDDDSDREDYKNIKDTWTYSYNGGSPILMLKSTAVKKSDDSSYFYEDTIELSFQNFFQGTYKNTLENDNGKLIPNDDVGNWQLFDTASLSTN
jgi:hypothetical protein